MDSIILQRNNMPLNKMHDFLSSNSKSPKVMEYITNLHMAINQALGGTMPHLIDKTINPPFSLVKLLFVYQKILFTTLQVIYIKLREIIRSNSGKFTTDNINQIIHEISEYAIRDKVFDIEKLSRAEISSADSLKSAYYYYFDNIDVLRNISHINNINNTLMALVTEGEIIPQLENDPINYNEAELKQYISSICKALKIEGTATMDNLALYIA